ncbi:hypothetical protein RRF57_003136 [Xylaria bambusicola]|uniref:Uncharacterized protein n=1 Tax=Xylaria bambusicola TaxID=326684 RepID=A0AAN7UJS9_9PEZI
MARHHVSSHKAVKAVLRSDCDVSTSSCSSVQEHHVAEYLIQIVQAIVASKPSKQRKDSCTTAHRLRSHHDNTHARQCHQCPPE